MCTINTISPYELASLVQAARGRFGRHRDDDKQWGQGFFAVNVNFSYSSVCVCKIILFIRCSATVPHFDRITMMVCTDGTVFGAV